MSYSFTNPVVDAKIWSPTDGEVDLSIFGGPEAIPYMQSVNIGMDMACMGEISLELSPTYEEAMRLLNETGWFRLGNQLGVRWGYNDGQPGHITDWIYGMMLLPELDLGEEVRLTIKANTLGARADMEESTKTWSKPDVPIRFLDVIEAIAKKYGFTVVFSDGGLLVPKSMIEDGLSPVLTEPRKDLIQSNLTDLQFLYRYIKMANLEMSIIGERMVIFMDPKTSLPAAEFHYYGKMDPAKNIFPMLSFAPKSLGPLFLPHSVYSTVMNGWNSDPNAVVETVEVTGAASAGASASTDNFYSGEQALETPGVDGPANPATGAKSNVARDVLTDVGKRVPLPIPDDMVKAEATSILQGVMSENAEDFGIGVSIGALALPTLFPNQIVRLRGVSNFFSVDYKISKIDVSITSSDASMELDLCSKGIPADMAQFADFVKMSSQGETQPGDGGEDVSADAGAGE